MFAKAKRGMSLLHEFAALTLFQLIEYVASSKIDIEAVHQHLVLEELMRLKVFKIDEKDKALRLVWKVDRLMREDTTRLDHLAIWDGKMLLTIDILMDEAEALQSGKDKLGGRNKATEEIRILNVDLSPGGVSKQAQQMNMAAERMMETWAWGYILEIAQDKKSTPAKLTGVKCKLVVQDYAIAMIHVVDVINQTEKWQSEIKTGMGPDEQWYEFEFGEFDEEGNYQQVFVQWEDGYAVIVSISDRGVKDESANPCRFLYYLDHRPQRQLNPQMVARPGSFNGKWSFTPGSRSVEMQVLLRVDQNFGSNGDDEEEEVITPTLYAKGVEMVQGAHWKVEGYLKRMRRGENIVEKDLEAARVDLRRLALSSCDEMFEDRLGYITSKKLMLEAPAHTTCAYNPKMKEFWVADSEIELNFIICSLDGRLKRDMALTATDNLKVFAFCFDNEGDLYIANNQNSFFRYIPADADSCQTYLRMWKVELFEPGHNTWKNASGVATHDEFLFGMFRFGPILQLSKAAGSIVRKIDLQFQVVNVEQVSLLLWLPLCDACLRAMRVCVPTLLATLLTLGDLCDTILIQMCYIMHRFIFVDAHMIKVCDLDGALVWVPLGSQGNTDGREDAESNPNAVKMGVNSDGHGGKQISWRSYIENGMDRPRIMWDGSFLWISETQLRKTDDNQIRVRSYMWHCIAPMTLAAHMATGTHAKRRYGKRLYMDLGVFWDSQGKLHSNLRDQAADLTPGTLPGSAHSQLPTPASKLDSSSAHINSVSCSVCARVCLCFCVQMWECVLVSLSLSLPMLVACPWVYTSLPV